MQNVIHALFNSLIAEFRVLCTCILIHIICLHGISSRSRCETRRSLVFDQQKSRLLCTMIASIHIVIRLIIVNKRCMCRSQSTTTLFVYPQIAAYALHPVYKLGAVTVIFNEANATCVGFLMCWFSHSLHSQFLEKRTCFSEFVFGAIFLFLGRVHCVSAVPCIALIAIIADVRCLDDVFSASTF